MPWRIAEKSYGKDKRYDAKYRIRFFSAAISLDVHCQYVYSEYHWHLSCEGIIQNLNLGTLKEMKEKEACHKALDSLEWYLNQKLEYIKGAREVLESHLDEEIDKFKNKS